MVPSAPSLGRGSGRSSWRRRSPSRRTLRRGR
uniref:Uncharacterized protein n=1 Tax=Arundo donax TaxID=35708 RepID=A0A0A9C0X4_ARUDO